MNRTVAIASIWISIGLSRDLSDVVALCATLATLVIWCVPETKRIVKRIYKLPVVDPPKIHRIEAHNICDICD
jgi:hypothetical protein